MSEEKILLVGENLNSAVISLSRAMNAVREAEKGLTVGEDETIAVLKKGSIVLPPLPEGGRIEIKVLMKDDGPVFESFQYCTPAGVDLEAIYKSLEDDGCDCDTCKDGCDGCGCPCCCCRGGR
jgi:hypothetical protein